MSKTSSSQHQHQHQNQTHPPQEETTIITIIQSPPLDDEIDGVMKPKIDDVAITEDYDDDDEKKNMCIIDVISNDNDDDDYDDEKVCRICQLKGSDHLPAGVGNHNLVLLGCACRGELSLSHYHCALVWFQRKGNRTCEICGQPAKNIAGIEDTGFRAYETDVENDIDIITSAEIAMNSGSNDDTDQRCGKCLSKLILAALVLAFLLPWAIRPDKLF